MPKEQTPDPESIQASDLTIDAPPEDPEAEAEETEDEESATEEPEGEPAEEEPEEPEEGAETPEPEEEPEEGDQPSITIDPEVAKAFPKEAKRLAEQVKGIDRLRAQLHERADRFNNLTTWENTLADSKTWEPALRELVVNVTKAHGSDPEKFLAKSPTKEDESEWSLTEYPSDAKVADEAALRAERAVMAKLGIDSPDDLKGLISDRKAARAESAFLADIAKVAPDVIKHLDTYDDGWKVTESMVAEAIRNLPSMKDKPKTAVRMWFSNERVKHHAAKATRGVRGPEGLRSVGREGYTFPDDPMKVQASDLTG